MNVKTVRVLCCLLCVVLLLCACAPGQGGPSTVPTDPNPTVPTQPTEAPDAWQAYAFTRFLTDTNLNGRIAPTGTIEAPGTLPDVSRIPAADQALVGQTVTVIFARMQQVIPFYYLCEGAAGTERLAVVIQTDRIPLLLVLETRLGGLPGLCDVIRRQESFEARILAATNISFEEGMYAGNAVRRDYALDPSEIYDLLEGEVLPEAGVFLGAFGTDDQGMPVAILKGSDGPDLSSGLQEDLSVYHKIYTRFDLLHLFPVIEIG